LDLSREFDVALGGTSFGICVTVLTRCDLDDWEGGCEIEGEESIEKGLSRMSSEDENEHQDWLCNIIGHHIKFHLLMIFWTFLTPLNPNLAIDSL